MSTLPAEFHIVLEKERKMKEEFENVVVEVVEFEASDVITDSNETPVLT